MMRCPRTMLPLSLLLLLGCSDRGVAAEPEGQLAWAVPVSILPAMLDPVDHQGGITAMVTFDALHDALVKPMPGAAMAPSLAESWSVSRDGLV